MTVYGHSMHERWSCGNHRPAHGRDGWMSLVPRMVASLGYFEKIIGFLELFEF